MLGKMFEQKLVQLKGKELEESPFYLLGDLDELGNRTLIPATAEEWGPWMQAQTMDNLRIGFDFINGITISTVFLGSDVSGTLGAPQIFETALFEGNLEEGESRVIEVVCRYSTYAEALAGHQIACKEVLKVGRMKSGSSQKQWQQLIDDLVKAIQG